MSHFYFVHFKYKKWYFDFDNEENKWGHFFIQKK